MSEFRGFNPRPLAIFTVIGSVAYALWISVNADGWIEYFEREGIDVSDFARSVLGLAPYAPLIAAVACGPAAYVLFKGGDLGENKAPWVAGMCVGLFFLVSLFVATVYSVVQPILEIGNL